MSNGSWCKTMISDSHEMQRFLLKDAANFKCHLLNKMTFNVFVLLINFYFSL